MPDSLAQRIPPAHTGRSEAATAASALAAAAAGEDVEEDGAAAWRLAHRAVVPHLAVGVAGQSERLHLDVESSPLELLRPGSPRHPDHVRDVDFGGTAGDGHHHGLALLVQRPGRGLLLGYRARRLLAVLVLLRLQVGAVRGRPVLGHLLALPDE